MKQLIIAVAVVLVSAAVVNADDHHKTWAKFFAGKWEVVSEDGKGEMDLKLVAKGTSVIGTGKDEEGRESAWILGWDVAEDRAIHMWFGDKGEHGQARYKMIDKDTLRGRGISRDSKGVAKGMVTLTRTSDDRYTVVWTKVTIDGKESDDAKIVAERKK